LATAGACRPAPDAGLSKRGHDLSTLIREFPPVPPTCTAAKDDTSQTARGRRNDSLRDVSRGGSLRGIRGERFWIFIHPEITRQEIAARATWMLDEANTACPDPPLTLRSLTDEETGNVPAPQDRHRSQARMYPAST
jgi:hypothetical protein